MPKNPKHKFPSELRSAPTSNDWVIIATGRSNRPETFRKEAVKESAKDAKYCPFCHIEKATDKVLAVYSKGKKVENYSLSDLKDWTTIVIPNKYPALVVSNSLNEKKVGPYRMMDGVGYHEVVVTRDHRKSMGQFSFGQVKEVMDVFQDRYLDLMDKPFVKYVSIFHNHGSKAGASIFHPHSQIMASPVIDPDFNRLLLTTKKYYKEHGKVVFCEMNEWERKQKTRVVFENKEFLVICPFVSRAAFEMTISSKKHLTSFERITEDEKKYLAEALQAALHKLYKGLNNPAYNFYLHTAPCDGKDYKFYQWHLTIMPKTAIMAGFELGTGIEISTIEPEAAAEFLRKQ